MKNLTELYKNKQIQEQLDTVTRCAMLDYGYFGRSGCDAETIEDLFEFEICLEAVINDWKNSDEVYNMIVREMKNRTYPEIDFSKFLTYLRCEYSLGFIKKQIFMSFCQEIYERLN